MDQYQLKKNTTTGKVLFSDKGLLSIRHQTSMWTNVPLPSAKTDLGPSWLTCPDNKVHVANMGPIWGRQDPGGPHVGPTNLAIWVD